MMTNQRGITLIEMLIVVSLSGLMVGITFPSVSAGIDSLRITSTSDSIVSFLNGALNRAELWAHILILLYKCLKRFSY